MASSDPNVIKQIEEQEAQWRHVDALLRRLLSRLTYAAEGRTAQLDATLDDLRAAARQPMDEARITPLMNALTDAVTALDEAPAPASQASGRQPATTTAAASPIAPPTAPAPMPALDRLLLAVLDHLQLGEEANRSLARLRRHIDGCTDEKALLQHGETLAELVGQRLQQLEDDKRAAGQLLAQVSGQLANLTEFLDQDDVAHKDVAAVRRQLDERMLGEVQALGDRARSAPDLATLQTAVQTRLEAVTSHLAALREREQLRERAWQERTDHMRERIQQLENNTKRMEASLELKRQLADTDALTGLANRRALEDRMVTLCSGNGGGDASLLILDIDHFKSINDQLGHAAGDRALRIVAEQLQAGLRPGDFLARYGGEEFVALLNAGPDEAMQVAQRLRQRIEKVRFHSNQAPVPVTISVGVTSLRADDSPESVFERADQALYDAKESGRNRCAAR